MWIINFTTLAGVLQTNYWIISF